MEPLTPREAQVLELLVKGCSGRQIAKALYMSDSTVKTHVSKIYEKIDVHSKNEAVGVAYESGLVRPAYLRKTTRFWMRDQGGERLLLLRTIAEARETLRDFPDTYGSIEPESRWVSAWESEPVEH